MSKISDVFTANGLSFGYHSSESTSVGSAATASNISTANKLSRVANTMRKVLLVGLIALGIATTLGMASFFALAAGFAGFIGASAFYYSSQYYHYKQICQTAGIVFQNAEQVKKFEVAGIKGTCEAVPTEHCADTQVWREDLIKAADHNIVISGNYCGGKSFAQFLALVQNRLKEKPDLKVVIISSPSFIKNGNLTKIAELKKKYPQNFSLIESPDIWHLSTGLKKSTNHTKCMVIDYGKYFILGGSGVKDNFAETGLDHLTKEEFLKQKKLEQQAKSQAESPIVTESSESPIIDSYKEELLGSGTIDSNAEDLLGSGTLPFQQHNQPEEEPVEDPNAEDGFIGKFIPGNFRDMDFVFKSNGGKSPSGKQVYKQMLLLCYRWEQYNQMLKNEFDKDRLQVNNLGVFTNQATDIDPEDSVVVQLLKKPIPKWENIKTRVPNFDTSTKKCDDATFRVFASGPEHDSSKFAEKLENKIKKAQNQIVINHMYFQPTSAIMNALIDAAKRGVKIKIITSGVYKDCPNSHLVFGPRNKYNYAYLVRSLSESEQKNVEVYEFQQKKKGNHKKVIVIDDMVIAGSSNLGYKSLVTTSDHELNFFARSQKFADETLKICDLDIQFSQKVDNPTAMSVRDCFKAFMHRIMAPLIG